MRSIHYRTLLPGETVSLPLSLKSSGCNSGEKGWMEFADGKQRTHVGIFWGIEGEAVIAINGKPHTVRGNEILYYFKYDSHKIEVTGDLFSYYWVTFDGTLCEELLRASVSGEGVIPAGKPPGEHFSAMFECLHNFSPNSISRGSVLGYQLLLMIKERQMAKIREDSGMHRENLLCERFTELVSRRYMEDSLNISAIARTLGIHRTTLVRLVRKKFNVSPVTYLKTARQQAALRLLYSSELSVKEIASLCGIADPCYFSRQIRKLTGKTPGEFRNSPAFPEC